MRAARAHGASRSVACANPSIARMSTARSCSMKALETRPVRGGDPAVGETTLMVYDLAKPILGGDDWLKSTIKGLRLDLDDDAGGEFTLYQVAIVNVPGGVSPAPEGEAAKAPAAP